jgi:hypothetical protein
MMRERERERVVIYDYRFTKGSWKLVKEQRQRESIGDGA